MLRWSNNPHRAPCTVHRAPCTVHRAQLWVLSIVLVITMSGLFMMAVSHFNLGAISAGIRDVKDFFVYASLGTDDQYIGYELSKGEVRGLT